MTIAIMHASVSAKPEQSDPTLQGPLEWNAAHSISLASQRVVGRNSAGIGAAEEVTASLIFDWVNNTNGVLLTRTAGTWGALARVTTDNGDIVLTDNAAPVSPAAGSKIISQSVTSGRSMFGWVGASGSKYTAQPWLGQTRRYEWIFCPNSAVVGLGGTAVAEILAGSTVNPTSTNLFTSLLRRDYSSTAGAGSLNGVYTASDSRFWRGNAAGLGGFTVVWRFGIEEAAVVATARMFAGVRAGVGAPTDVDPSTLTDLIGVGCNNGDTNLQLYAAGAVAQARVNLGANFPVNTHGVDVYELVLHCNPNDTVVTYTVNRLNTGDTVSGSLTGANISTNTTFLTPAAWRTNGGTAAAVTLALMGMYGETSI
jgi:hypothetical protein